MRRAGATVTRARGSTGREPQNLPTSERRARSRLARNATTGFAARLHAWVLQHAHVLFFSLGQLCRAPVSTLMTAMVIGIALALPAGLFLILQNVAALHGNWEGTTQISLFLKETVNDRQVPEVANEVRSMPDVAAVQIITRTQAMQEFRKLSGFGAALNALVDNPLPAVLVVHPSAARDDRPATAAQLFDRLRVLPQVDIAQFDMQWLQRLNAMTALARRGVAVLAVLLALAVLLIVGNTIRLMIYSRRDEIEIVKLIGATNAFVQRPFLYSGLWFGVFGAVIASLVLYLSLWLLADPVRTLASLYGSTFHLASPGFASLLILLASGGALGFMGSLLAVKRHVASINPA